MDEAYLYVIVALLPLSAGMVILQTNPYHALIIRGILGAVAALVYAVLGAADVALTEALVGTMLAITLYAVAVRSSLVMRLGVLKDSLAVLETEDAIAPSSKAPTAAVPLSQLLQELRQVLRKYHMRLELVPYMDAHDLHQALVERDVHATCVPTADDSATSPYYQTVTRIQRLHDILQAELPTPSTQLHYLSAAAIAEGEK